MLNPKDSSEQTNDLKSQANKGNIAPHKDKRVLEIGLQAANQMMTFSSQTYYNRMVQSSCQYDANDFINKIKEENKEVNLEAKLERFIDRVSYSIESALSSNEIINVFQDDF